MATKRYIVTLDDVRKKYHPSPPSWIRITTITMLCKFMGDVDIEKIRAAFADGPIRIRRKGALTNGFEWSLKNAAFYNQVTVGYEDQYSNKSIKMFPNGSVQVAGCSDLRDCKRIMRQLSFLVQRVTEREEPLKIDNFRVVMINTNFSMNSSVNLMKVIEVLAAENKFDVTYNPLEIERLPTNPLTENDRFIVSFNPERYSAVKVKFHPAANTKQVTASIFSTGKIIVTGAETLREIALAYEVLNEKLQSTKIEATKEDTFDVIKGNKFDDIVSKLRQEGVVRF
jgi:TATA-box binding protein (TBP) (component of TFIID and TFIIIB)